MYCSQCGDSALNTSKFCNKCGAALIPPVMTSSAPSRPPPLPSAHLRAPPPPLTPRAPASHAASTAPLAPTVYAGFGRRAGAWLIDFVLIFLVYCIPSAYLSSRPYYGAYGPLVVLALFAWVYKATMESSQSQATFGKRWLHLKVTSLTGERISFSRATGRSFAEGLSQLSFYVGYLAAAFTERRQALHDLIAGTLVVRRDATPAEIALSAPAARSNALFVIAMILLCGIPVIGILAAISIPAYQDYTIRAQVSHGLNLADPYKLAVAQALSAGTDSLMINSGPGGTIGADLPGTGTYEDSVQVVAGNIMIRYGQRANPHLMGRHLEIYMIQNADGSLTWVCGKSSPPAGQNESSLRAYRKLTDVPDRYLPTTCKG
jgi:uncharacterized RDD family membrane protein YckC/Tfp pilus assembly major pilin PilA